MKCRVSFVAFLLLLSSSSYAAEAAIHLVTYIPGGFRIDATEQGNRVRRLLTRIQDLGIQTLIFNFRGRMIGGRSSDIEPLVASRLNPNEETLLIETIEYAKQLGFQVAFRPIVLVVGPNWEFPYEENGHLWWHGNIEPRDVNTWFRRYFEFHEPFLRLASKTGISWYSIGAEMHSMTSGLGSRYPRWRHGYPKEWVNLIRKAKQILTPTTKVTYGINFTDQYVLERGQRTWGGEFEQWRVDISHPARNTKEQQHQIQLRALWQELDFIGLDYYRALGAKDRSYPSEFSDLVEQLTPMTNTYALQIESARKQIVKITGSEKEVALQEVGYRSVDKCFVSPYLYEDGSTSINYIHQAAAWESLLQASLQFTYQSVGIWQVLVDDDSDLEINSGFSPLGKIPTTNVFKRHFLPPAKKHKDLKPARPQ